VDDMILIQFNVLTCTASFHQFYIVVYTRADVKLIVVLAVYNLKKHCVASEDILELVERCFKFLPTWTVSLCRLLRFYVTD